MAAKQVLTQVHHDIDVAAAAHRAPRVKCAAQGTLVLVVNVEHARRGGGMVQGTQCCSKAYNFGLTWSKRILPLIANHLHNRRSGTSGD